MGNIDKNHLVTLKNRYPLTKEGSTKQTWHVTLDLKGSDLQYEPGDSIGVYPQNDPTLVEHLIQAMQATPTDTIFHKRSGQTLTLHHFLTHHANLSRITSSFLKLITECEECKSLTQLLDPVNKPQLKEFLTTYDPLNLLRDYAKQKLPLQELCDQFGPLLPRFYSIASSKWRQKDTLDLTIALFTWDQSGEKRWGVASHFLCHLAEVGETTFPIYLQPARHFRLPENPHANLIMVGPGTGIAPFRAFMQERVEQSSTGKHWLFFGERNRSSDYFYEDEWKAFENLRMETAFSRDQKEKIYVQHRMLEKGDEIYQWLEEGAYFYVCGDAKEMAKDVDKSLHQILITKGNHSEETAKEYVKRLKKEGRYLLDVY